MIALTRCCSSSEYSTITGTAAITAAAISSFHCTRYSPTMLAMPTDSTNIDASGRNRQRGYGGPEAQHDPKVEEDQMAGRVIDVAEVAALVVDGIRRNRLYLLPHAESRAMIRRRFERIDRAFEE